MGRAESALAKRELADCDDGSCPEAHDEAHQDERDPAKWAFFYNHFLKQGVERVPSEWEEKRWTETQTNKINFAHDLDTISLFIFANVKFGGSLAGSPPEEVVL